ncbi:hypothetical protein NKH77_35465 [Streptomyces sp. M19]
MDLHGGRIGVAESPGCRIKVTLPGRTRDQS